MTPETYLDLKKQILNSKYYQDIEWSENIKPCKDAWYFFVEYVFVICNSGMKNTVARKIFNRVISKIATENSTDFIHEVFKHKGKVKAIRYVWTNRYPLFINYRKAKDKLEFCKIAPLDWRYHKISSS